jgi:hypothetical protein
MKPLALGVAINVLLILLAVIAYDQYARLRELRVAVVDVAAVYRWKEAQFTALLTQPGTDLRADASAPQLAAKFAQELPQALDDIAAECRCLLLTRAVLAGPPEHVATHVADLTATLKQKLGMP